MLPHSLLVFSHPRSTACNTHSKAKVIWEVGGEDIKRREIEQTHSKPAKTAHAEVEREYVGILGCTVTQNRG